MFSIAEIIHAIILSLIAVAIGAAVFGVKIELTTAQPTHVEGFN